MLDSQCGRMSAFANGNAADCPLFSSELLTKPLGSVTVVKTMLVVSETLAKSMVHICSASIIMSAQILSE